MHDQFVAGPERPIRLKAEDLLDRSRFVERLCDAIINRDTQRSTGVTIGLTGEWGSGKSSILNLLDEQIAQRYPNAVVVRFDPWLVSGRDDLIRQFFLEFQAAIKEKPALKARLAQLVERLGQYSSDLAPILNVTLPGGGDALAGGVAIMQKALSRDRTLHQQREDLMKTLQDSREPFIVLIDELDRIEDAEIRAAAQLVRAVADFPSISYVLAYDLNRVIQALGTGGNSGRLERGRAYLEKIVQFQIRLPVSLENEIETLLNAELISLKDELGLPQNWQEVKRFRELIGIVVPRGISTPRDIKRLIGTYHVIGSMVKGEVDWCDLLAFSILTIKAPATVAKLSQQPDMVVQNPFVHRVYMERFAQHESKPDERLAMFVCEEEREFEAVKLLAFLFPWFSSSKGRESRNPESLCYRRPLLTVLRLGLLPNAFSADDVRAFLASNVDQIEQRLWRLYEDGRLQAFLERFDEVYPRVGSQNDNAVWLAISRFLRKKDNFWPKAYSPMRELLQQFYSIFWELCAALDEFRDEAAAVVQSLKADGDIELVSWIMREEAARHGIFKADATDHSVLIFKEREEVSVLVSKMADGFRTDHLKTDWLIQRSDPHPLFLALDAGVWDLDCQERLDVLLRNDETFDIFVLLLFGGNNMVERSSLARLLNLDKYLARLEGRLASSSLGKVHPTVRAALEKAAKRG